MDGNLPDGRKTYALGYVAGDSPGSGFVGAVPIKWTGTVGEALVVYTREFARMRPDCPLGSRMHISTRIDENRYKTIVYGEVVMDGEPKPGRKKTKNRGEV